MNNTHIMGPTTLKHGESQCVNCKATNREIDLALGPVCPQDPTTTRGQPVLEVLADVTVDDDKYRFVSETFAEGDPCPLWAVGDEVGTCPCKGVLEYPPVENCACHISPPCGACTDVALQCSVCGWEVEDLECSA